MCQVVRPPAPAEVSPADPDELFWRDLGRHDRPGPARTRHLLARVAAIPPADRAGARRAEYLDARDRLAVGHLRLAYKVVRHYRMHAGCRSLTVADLVLAGFHGLCRAVDRFDPARGTALSTFAFPWVRQSVQRAVRNTDRLIRLPAHRFDPGRRLPRAEFRRLTEFVPLTRHVPAPDPGAPDCERADSAAAVRRSLRTLDARSRDVLTRRFGLGGAAETLEEIGAGYGLTRERVRQIEAAALAKLRPLLGPERGS